MREVGLFSETMLQKIQKARKIFLKFAVWILIAELVFGAILILVGSWNVTLGRIQGTFLVIALILLISVNNFIRIEKGNKMVQIFALMGFVCNLLFGIFACLLLWEVVPFYWTEQVMRTNVFGEMYPSTKRHLTIWAIIMYIFSYAAAAGFWISNVMSIKETIKPVKPLKITAIVCMVYLWIFETIITPIGLEAKDVERLYQLAGLAALAFGITALAAWIISRTNQNKVAGVSMAKSGEATQFGAKTDAELRMEIEEKVKREMIEKEVRERLEAERAGNAGVDDATSDGDEAKK